MQVPGKEDFAETLRYYRRRLEVLGVDVRLGDARPRRPTSPAYDEVVVATGVVPAGAGDRAASTTRRCVTYAEVLSGAVVVRARGSP